MRKPRELGGCIPLHTLRFYFASWAHTADMTDLNDLSFRIPALSPNNEMLVGILANGDLVADEAAGAGNSFGNYI